MKPHSTTRPKISQSIWEFAGDFIRLGNGIDNEG